MLTDGLHRATRTFAVAAGLSLLPSLAGAQHYVRTDLVSDTAAPPVVLDTNVRNAWGLVHGPSTPWWLSNNASGTSTLVNATNLPVALPSLVVTIPPPPSQPGTGTPTGMVFNGNSTDFLLAPGKPAIFLWATEDGMITGWNPGVKATDAVITVDNSQKPSPDRGAVYKGLTIGEIRGQRFLFAANFRSRRIDVFDSAFNQVHVPHWAFHDDDIPRDFGPFNIQGIGPNLYVTYAKQDDTQHDDVPGAGLGFVDVFSTQGKLLARLQHGPWLNAPWGIAQAPAYFGEFSHCVLVGNFGGGTIAAYNPVTGRFVGNFLNPDGSTLFIDGLWGLGFGNGGPSGPGNTLFFTAGPNEETNGVFGTLTPTPAESDNDEP